MVGTGPGVRTGTGVEAGVADGADDGDSGGNVCSDPVGAADVTGAAGPPLQFGGQRGALNGLEHVHFATMRPCAGSRHTGVPGASTDWNENGQSPESKHP